MHVYRSEYCLQNLGLLRIVIKKLLDLAGAHALKTLKWPTMTQIRVIWPV